VVGELNDLVDQGSKLAFQVAMEVARLGNRGERLLPMTQTLEELTTNFRQVAGKLQDESGSEAVDDSMSKLQSQLRQLQEMLASDGDLNWQELADQSAEIGPAAGKVAKNLEEIARTFNRQAERLIKLGQSVADLTSVEFDTSEQAAGNPDAPPEGSLKIESADPFASTEESIHKPAEVDPFSGAEPVLGDPAAGDRDLTFSSSVTPGAEDTFTTAADEYSADLTTSHDDPAPPESIVDPNPAESIIDASPIESIVDSEPSGSILDTPVADPAPADPTPLDEPQDSIFDNTPEIEIEMPETGVSGESETVYDLSDLGAVPVEESSSTDEDGETIHELSEFGAVPLT
jgi:hypothetical protein